MTYESLYRQLRYSVLPQGFGGDHSAEPSCLADGRGKHIVPIWSVRPVDNKLLLLLLRRHRVKPIPPL